MNNKIPMPILLITETPLTALSLEPIFMCKTAMNTASAVVICSIRSVVAPGKPAPSPLQVQWR
jgi:hypothetical protein